MESRHPLQGRESCVNILQRVIKIGVEVLKKFKMASQVVVDITHFLQ